MTAFSKFLLEDWYFAWPLLGMSCIALTLVFWRLFLNFEARTNLDIFLPLFHDALTRAGKDGALRLCRGRRDLIPGSLYVAGLETADQGLAAMRRAMAAVIELEILPSLNFLLAPILAIAKVATMLGLLGTVISMIQTFDALGRPDAGTDLTQHAAGIGLALFATALGLTTAIPLVFAHVLFRAWVTRFEVQLKSAAQKLLVVVQAHEQTRRAEDQQPKQSQQGLPSPCTRGEGPGVRGEPTKAVMVLPLTPNPSPRSTGERGDLVIAQTVVSVR